MNIKISFFQMKSYLGNIEDNAEKIINYYDANNNSDLIVTPELSLCGYFPQDNLFSESFQELINKITNKIILHTINSKTALLLGTSWFENKNIYNVMLLIKKGKIEKIIYKEFLPFNSVFIEYRYFKTKPINNNIITINKTTIALFVCEDLWHKKKVDSLKSKHDIDLIISTNASPFAISKTSSKHKERIEVAQYACKTLSAPLFYVNGVGGVDDIIFDGSSFVMNKNGEELGSLLHAQEDSMTCIVNNKNINFTPHKSLLRYDNYESDALIYESLMLGLKDFLHQTNFSGIIVGLSGGIDSALVTALAVDSVGSENVICISMPSKYTSELSYKIIESLKQSLNVKVIEIPIDNLMEAYINNLTSQINLHINNILENIQSRIRGHILMSFANHYSTYALLCTSNKSEVATGYSTLYGDSCGAYAPLKDVYKTQVFSLSEWRNINIPSNSKFKHTNLITNMCIKRKPSAELKENQYDESSLSDYTTLDKLLYDMIEENKSESYLSLVYNKELMIKIAKLLKISHYKRLQSPLGANVSKRPFGKDYIYNISDQFKSFNE